MGSAGIQGHSGRIYEFEEWFEAERKAIEYGKKWKEKTESENAGAATGRDHPKDRKKKGRSLPTL
ncbi:MAG: hypothetical protein H7839_24345 [Magnetococcus sp. YQC-5]